MILYYDIGGSSKVIRLVNFKFDFFDNIFYNISPANKYLRGKLRSFPLLDVYIKKSLQKLMMSYMKDLILSECSAFNKIGSPYERNFRPLSHLV